MSLDIKKYFVYNGKNDEAKFRLFCFPFAGSGASMYAKWQECFSNNKIQIMPIQLPGRENRYSEKYEKNIIQMVKDIAKNIQDYIDRPFAIFGHSMGGAFAYEFAHELINNYGKSPTVLFVSASSAPHTLSKCTFNKSELTEDEFLSLVDKFNGMDPELFNIREYYEYFAPILKNDFMTVGNYKPKERFILDIPIHALYGYDDISMEKDNILLWNEYSNKAVSFKEFKGEHFFIKEYYADICKYIEDTLMLID